MLKKSDTSASESGTPAPKKRPHIKPPEIRPRPASAGEGNPSRPSSRPARPGRPGRSSGPSDRSIGAARATASKFGNGGNQFGPRPNEGAGEKGNPDAVRFVPLGGLEE